MAVEPASSTTDPGTSQRGNARTALTTRNVNTGCPRKSRPERIERGTSVAPPTGPEDLCDEAQGEATEHQGDVPGERLAGPDRRPAGSREHAREEERDREAQVIHGQALTGDAGPDRAGWTRRAPPWRSEPASARATSVEMASGWSG